MAKRPPLDLRLFADLAVNRLWLIGITIDIAASVMQAIALHFGPLALVQPILVLDLLFAVVITAVLARRRPDRVVGAGVLCCTGGLVLFLAVARPQSPAVSVAPTILLPLGVGIAGVIALCLVAWRVSPRRFLPLATAFACGAIFEAHRGFRGSHSPAPAHRLANVGGTGLDQPRVAAVTSCRT